MKSSQIQFCQHVRHFKSHRKDIINLKIGFSRLEGMNALLCVFEFGILELGCR